MNRFVARLILLAMSAVFLAQCQTTNDTAAVNIAAFELPEIGGIRTPGILPVWTGNGANSIGRHGINLKMLMRADNFDALIELEGFSTAELMPDGQLRRTEHYRTLDVNVKKHGLYGGSAYAKVEVPENLFIEEIWSATGQLVSYRAFDVDLKEVRVVGDEKVGKAMLLILGQFFLDNTLHRRPFIHGRPELGDFIYPRTYSEAVTRFQNLLPALERGGQSSAQMSLIKWAKHSIELFRDNSNKVTLDSDVQIRGRWSLNGKHYIFASGRYQLAYNDSAEITLELDADLNVLIDPSSGVQRAFFGTMRQRSNLEGTGGDLRAEFQFNYQLPLYTDQELNTISSVDSATTGESSIVPMAISWVGVENLMIGKLSFTQNAGKGEIRATAGALSCRGNWQFVSGEYGTSNVPRGTWAMTCSNGKAAAGSYVSTKPANGTGRGRDTDGNDVKLTFGSN